VCDTCSEQCESQGYVIEHQLVTVNCVPLPQRSQTKLSKTPGANKTKQKERCWRSFDCDSLSSFVFVGVAVSPFFVVSFVNLFFCNLFFVLRFF